MLKENGYAKLQPMYPLLIQQFVDDYKLDKGIAVDIGVGPGWLGMELAKITNMDICFFDIDQNSLDLAKENIGKIGIDNKISFVLGDVEDIPLDDNYADFIMSRGSMWFWKNPEKGLSEIQRILKPGGTAIVGGGLGRYIPDTMRNRLLEGRGQHQNIAGFKKPTFQEFCEIAKRANLTNYSIETDGESKSGRWVVIKKN